MSAPVRGYKVFINLNKEVFLWGLKPDHALYFFVSLLLLAIALKWVCIPVYFFLFILVNKVKKQTKLGNPDYVQDLMVYMKSPKTIEDTTGAMQKLIPPK